MIDEMTIDISELLLMYRKKILHIVVCSIICGLLVVVATFLFVDKKYSSESTIYITPKVNDLGSIDFNTLETNSKLVNNYIEIMKSDFILSKVSAELELDDVSSVIDSLEIKSKPNTEVISIEVITEDPKLSCNITNSIVKVFSKQMKDILNIENITVLSYAEINNVPVSPNLKINFVKGILIGAILPIIYLLIVFLLDRRLKSRNAVEHFLDIPVLVCIPYAENNNEINRYS